MRIDEGLVQIVYIDEQWIIQIGERTKSEEPKIFIIEKLGSNSRVTAFQKITSMESLKTYLKDLSLLKNIVNQSRPAKPIRYDGMFASPRTEVDSCAYNSPRNGTASFR